MLIFFLIEYDAVSMSAYHYLNVLHLSPLRIDNAGLALISLKFTYLLIESWLFGSS